MNEIKSAVRCTGGAVAILAPEGPRTLFEARVRVIDWMSDHRGLSTAPDRHCPILIIDPDDRPWGIWAKERQPFTFWNKAITVAKPQRDELRIPRVRNDPTVALDLDTWPLVDGVSTIYEEMLAWSFGPIWVSYRDESHPLVQQFLTNAAPAAAA